MKKRSTLLFGGFLAAHSLFAQCDTTHISGDFILSDNQTLSGVYYVSGLFHVADGVVISTQPYVQGGCGKIEVIASSIVIEGEINADYAGYPGGTNGAGASSVSSLTGHAGALTACVDIDNKGIITVEGGKAGSAGEGPGKGLAGANGGNGSGPKQVCGYTTDYYGMIPGSGGAGAGGGASYGGNGTNGAVGGNGSATHSTNGAPVQPDYPVNAGTGGSGGSKGVVYGTADGLDIDLGSGGAGSGGAGRSYSPGSTGAKGGNGGGLIILTATNDIEITGTLSVNGQNGSTGGVAGAGGATEKCCSDPCNDCGEVNLSSGAGGGSGSGAGSGGGILIKASTATITGVMSSAGGTGGNGGAGGSGTSCTYSGNIVCSAETISTGQGAVGGKGGDASGGRIKIFVQDCNTNQINPVIAINGGGAAEEGTYSMVCNAFASTTSTESVQFSMYPNPAGEQLTIQLYQVSNTVSTISLVDVKGAVLQQIESANSITTVDVSALDSGLYFVTISSGNSKTTSKFIKK